MSGGEGILLGDLQDQTVKREAGAQCVFQHAGGERLVGERQRAGIDEEQRPAARQRRSLQHGAVEARHLQRGNASLAARVFKQQLRIAQRRRAGQADQTFIGEVRKRLRSHDRLEPGSERRAAEDAGQRRHVRQCGRRLLLPIERELEIGHAERLRQKLRRPVAKSLRGHLCDSRPAHHHNLRIPLLRADVIDEFDPVDRQRPRKPDVTHHCADRLVLDNQFG